MTVLHLLRMLQSIKADPFQQQSLTEVSRRSLSRFSAIQFQAIGKVYADQPKGLKQETPPSPHDTPPPTHAPSTSGSPQAAHWASACGTNLHLMLFPDPRPSLWKQYKTLSSVRKQGRTGRETWDG